MTAAVSFVLGIATGAALMAWHCAKVRERTEKEAFKLAHSIQRQMLGDAKKHRGLS